MNKYDYWFGRLEGVGRDKKLEAFARGLGGEEIYKMTLEELDLVFTEKQRDMIIIGRKFWDLDAEAEALTSKNVNYITVRDSEYPANMRNLNNMPFGLFVKGKLPVADRLSAAIVGSRMCTPYGKEMAERIAGIFAENDVQVISGMARGIDSIAQRAALKAGGDSYAVLGCGVDICYPSRSLDLYMELEKKGGIISEQIVGTPGKPEFFPARNRIISGMADIVCVIEAKERSGSLITADFALEQGKEVVALPGRVTDITSYGCNYLIYQGATIYVGPDTLKYVIEETARQKKLDYHFRWNKKSNSQDLLEKKEFMVYSVLRLQPKKLEEILEEVPLLYTEVVGILMDLQLKGLVEETTKNNYICHEG